MLGWGGERQLLRPLFCSLPWGVGPHAGGLLAKLLHVLLEVVKLPVEERSQHSFFF